METDILKEIGLTPNEIKVYMALLKARSALASKLSQETKLQRTNVYLLLNSLIEKGVVSYVIKNGRKYFTAIEPEKLIKFIETEKLKVEEKEKRLREFIESLKKQKIEPEKKVIVEVYEGIEGLKTIMEDILKTIEKEKEYFSFGWSGVTQKVLKFYAITLHKKRIKLGIKRKIIVSESLKGCKELKQPLTELKFLPEKVLLPVSIIIYDNKIVQVIALESKITSILIENKELAERYKEYFDILWRQAK